MRTCFGRFTSRRTREEVFSTARGAGGVGSGAAGGSEHASDAVNEETRWVVASSDQSAIGRTGCEWDRRDECSRQGVRGIAGSPWAGDSDRGYTGCESEGGEHQRNDHPAMEAIESKHCPSWTYRR